MELPPDPESDCDAADQATFASLMACVARLRRREEVRRVRDAIPDAESGGYVSPEGRHRHRCACGVVYEHDDSPIGSVREVHTCPGCYQSEPDSDRGWQRYFGPLPPVFHDPGLATFRRSDDPPPECEGST